MLKCQELELQRTVSVPLTLHLMCCGLKHNFIRAICLVESSESTRSSTSFLLHGGHSGVAVSASDSELLLKHFLVSDYPSDSGDGILEPKSLSLIWKNLSLACLSLLATTFLNILYALQ